MDGSTDEVFKQNFIFKLMLTKLLLLLIFFFLKKQLEKLYTKNKRLLD
jgi:hypothetical protein